jgi:hypothetical protein
LANSSPIAQIFLKKGKPGDSRPGREFFEADVEMGNAIVDEELTHPADYQRPRPAAEQNHPAPIGWSAYESEIERDLQAEHEGVG